MMENDVLTMRIREGIIGSNWFSAHWRRPCGGVQRVSRRHGTVPGRGDSRARNIRPPFI